MQRLISAAYMLYEIMLRRFVTPPWELELILG
jgi:hypothetical protein